MPDGNKYDIGGTGRLIDILGAPEAGHAQQDRGFRRAARPCPSAMWATGMSRSLPNSPVRRGIGQHDAAAGVDQPASWPPGSS